MGCYNILTNYFIETTIVLGVIIQVVCSFFKSIKIANRFAIATFIFSLVCLLFFCTGLSNIYILLFKDMLILSSLLIFLLKTKRVFIKKAISFNIIYLMSLFFLLMIINSNDFLSLYANIEFFSINLYFLISADKFKLSLKESLKYLFSSVLASSIMLLGVAFLYGLIGDVNFEFIRKYITNNSDYSFSTYTFPYMLILSGLIFKLGMLPFGRWMADIFKNIDTKIVTYISIVPKISIFGVLVKVLGSFINFETTFMLILFALFTLFFAVYFGFKTSNIKLLMASSSYLNISYILVALALYNRTSVSTMLFYLISYIFMNIGAFAAISCLENSNVFNKDMEFKGYFYKNKIFAVCFAFCILSLWGMPVTSGFVSKIYFLFSVVNSGWIFMPVILLLFATMCLSVCFYLRMLTGMFEAPGYCVVKANKVNKYVLYGCSCITLLLGIFPYHLIKFCKTIVTYMT